MKKSDRAYKSDKRRKEIEKQKKQEMKRQRRLNKSDSTDEPVDETAAPVTDGEPAAETTES